jgi:hypothetical protein
MYGAGGVGYGLVLGNGAQLLSQGTATDPVHVAEYNTVQEQTPAGWAIPWYALVGDGIGSPAAFDCRFTDFSCMAQDSRLLYAYFSPAVVRDCQMHGGFFTSNEPLTLTNSLLERVYSDIEPSDNVAHTIRNCLFYGGSFVFYPPLTNDIVKDNLFDRTAINADMTGWGNYDGGYNAFITNCSRILPTNSFDLVLTNTDYQIGPLGNYYYPTNGGMLSRLINAGSTNADQVGLYHYTVMTNLIAGLEIKETNSIVDIGYHFVAVGTNGLPISTSGDGLGDYFKDSNGNGLYDVGVDFGNWHTYDSPNGLTNGSGLVIFTPLR